MGKRFLAALLCLSLTAGLCLPAYAAETNALPAELEQVEELETAEVPAPETKVAARDALVSYAVEGGNIYFDPATGAITDCDSSVTKADIPSSINGVAVTSIGIEAFEWCSGLKSVTIPDSVTSIETYAFFCCSGLTSVTIPNSVTSMGNGAFYGCSSLTSAGEIGSGCDYQFGWTDSIPHNAFNDCDWLTSITIPNSITSIGRSAFYRCDKLRSVTIPDGITRIEDSTFSRCGLTSITIPNSVSSIGNSVFSSCWRLTSVTIPDSVTNIGSFAFQACTSLTDVTIPDGITSIEEYTFDYCNNLKNITIPDSVTNIGDCSFAGCSGLTSVSIPDSVTNIGGGAFAGCSGLTSVSIPDSVTNIGEGAFAGCSGLTSVTIPDSVTSIGKSAFNNCSGLIDIIVIDNNLTYSDIDGVLFDKNKESLIAWPAGREGNYTIPTSVVNIGEDAFYYCSKLKGITIPDSVTNIEKSSFSGCSGLTSITLPNSVTNIGEWAFCKCSSLTSITIPSDVTSIGVATFEDCKGLERVTIPDAVTSIKQQAFRSCTGLKDVYYSGSEVQWNAITIEHLNEPLTSAAIHYNYNNAPPQPAEGKIPVHSTDESAIIDAALSQADLTELFEDISLDIGKMHGPSVTIAGKKFYLFEIGGSLDIPLKKLPVQISVNRKEKTLQVLLGFKEAKGGTTIVGDPNSHESPENDFSKSYLDAKDLMKTVTGKWPNSRAFHDKFQKISDNLKKMNMDMIVSASGKVSGYLELSYETGKLKFSEGGAILAVSVKSTLNGRIPAFPAAYVTLRFEVSAEGKLKLVVDEDSIRFNPIFDAAIKAAIGIGLGDNTGKLQAYIEGGFDGELGAHVRPMGPITGEDLFSVDMTGSLYFSWKYKVWLWGDGDTYKKKLFKLGLFPRLESIPDMDSRSLTTDDYLADAKPVTREYLYAPVPLGITDDYSFSKVEYPYAEPTLLCLRDGRKLLVWVGDDGEKADADRTSIFYSIYANGAWSTPAAIHESGFYADHPVLCQDGETVYAVWMQADAHLEGMDAQEVFGRLDLMFSAFDGNGWSTPERVSEAGNGLAETDYTLSAKDGTVSVVWIDNSANDMLMASGTNAIHLRTYANGVWGAESEVDSTDEQISGLSVDRGDGLRIAWTVTNSDGETAAYQREGDEPVQSAPETDQNIRWINGGRWELHGGELFKDGAGTGLTGVTNYEIVSSGEQTAVLTLVPTGFTCELYGSYYDSGAGTWGPWVQLTNYGKYIRSYSAVLDESGKLVAALNLVNTDAEAEKVYDNASAMLVVVDDCQYSDLAAGDWLSYDAGQIVPGGTLPLTFEITNNSLEQLNSFTADINGQSQEISCELGAGESGVFTANYQLPAELRAHEVTLRVTPGYAAGESNTENNSVSVQIGTADLKASLSAPELNAGGASVKIEVANEGYADAENAVLTVYRSNFEGETLCTAELGAIEAGGRTEYVYQLPDELLSVNEADTMNALCCEVVSDTEEWELENNSDRIVYDNLSPLQVTLESGTNSVNFTVAVKNMGNADSESVLMLALYEESGKMLTVRSRALTLAANGNDTVEFTIDRSQNLNAARAEVFWLDKGYAPITQSWKGAYPPES